MPRRRGKPRNNYQNNSTATVTTTTVSTPRGGRRSAVTAASAGKVPAGRNTHNSRGNRGRRPGGSTRKAANNGRAGTRGRGRTAKKDSTQMQDPTTYKDENGEVYKRGDFAYVDSQQPELPYHICVINDFKFARRDTVIAEIKWFYRVSELPEAVYLLLMEDRKNDPLFSDPKAKERELFMAFNPDTHPASLLRGKCKVQILSEIEDSLSSYMEKDHTFFYNYGYKPESRRLTLLNEESFVPHSQQAVLPECLCPDGPGRPSPSLALDRYSQQEEKIEYAKLVWQPKLSDDDLLMYLRAARSIALHAGVCMTSNLADGYLAASSDETTQQAFDVLHKNGHSTENALLDLVKRPTVSRLIAKKKWSKENAVLFGKGMRQFGKNFTKIQQELLPGKKISELVEYYYYWKKTNAGLSSRNTRRQRKMAHIRLSRSLLKPRQDTPEKEFMDWESCDEDDDYKGKPKNDYICHHCFSQQSSSWHHAGPAKAILCQSCQLYFQHYGIMCPQENKREPPEFLYRDYHESAPQDDNSSSSGHSHTLQSPPTTGRKTRNSNGSRGGPSNRPGLRSKKNNKSDTEEEEAEASGESADESSCEDEVLPVKRHKPLQARHSLLEDLDDASKALLDVSKRPKRDDNMITMSEFGSGESTNGDQEQETDHTQKSPAPGEKSPGQSSSSSTHADDERDSPCSSNGSAPRAEAPEGASSCIPQQFRRVSKDPDSSCARTDLVYVHMPAAEKELATSTTKVPLTGHGSSAHGGGGGVGGHLLEQQAIPGNVKVPLITPHEPALPIGPPAMMGFPPVPYPPMTPQTAVAGQPVPIGPMQLVTPDGGFIKQNSIEGGASREEQLQQQQIALWQQQQQQQLAALQLSQMQVSHGAAAAAAIPVQTPGSGFVAAIPPHSSHAPPPGPPHPEQAKMPHQAFTFPGSAEELHNRRLMEQLAIQGIALPPGVHLHPQVLETLYAQQAAAAAASAPPSTSGAPRPITTEELMQGAGPHQGQARILLGPPAEMIAAGYPPEAVAISMEQLMAQQQQQQQLAITQQQLMELEKLAMQVQNDPSLLQNMQVQVMMQQREQLIQAMRMHEMMVQQQQQQQQELHKKQQQQFVLSRPPVGHEDPASRSRPGVIVNQTK